MRLILLVALLLLSLTVPASADSGLVLTASVEPDLVPFSGAVTFVVTFENRSSETIRFFEPLHAGLVTFPSLRLISMETGKTFRPYDSPFQSMAQPGLAGTVIELQPGQKKEYRLKRDRFGLVSPKTGQADWKAKAPLPPGRYRVEAGYAKKDDKAWFNTGGFKAEERRLEGIFTGKLTAEPITFTVHRPNRPWIAIAPPEKGKAEVLLTFANPTSTEHVFAGSPILDLSSKAYGGGRAHPAVVRDGDAKEGERIEIRVPAGGKKEVRVRLRALSFASRGAGPFGLGEIIPKGVAHARFTLIDMERTEKLATDGIFIQIPRPTNRGLGDVKVTASATATEVTVEVENTGTKDVALLHRMSFPRDILIRIEDADGKRPSIGSVTRKAGGLDAPGPVGEGASKLARGLSWDGDAFKRPGPIKRSDLIHLEPGSGMQRTFDLKKLLTTALTPGRYRIRVGYRNYESGERFGYAEKRWAPVGVVWSEPVMLIVR